MERYDVGRDDRFDEMLAAVDRGEEVVLIRDGREVAQLVPTPARAGSMDLDKLAAVQHVMSPLRASGESGVELIRNMRDASGH